MSMPPLVSVCIPAYNQPASLMTALRSVLRQTYEHFEVLIADDSTSDEVERALGGVCDDRVLYHRNTRRLGPAGNWNSLIDMSRGSLIKYMHHDDWFTTPSALERLVQELVTSSAGFAFCASTAVEPDGLVRSVNRPSAALVAALHSDASRLWSLGNFIGAPSATLFRRDTAITFDSRLQWLVDMDFYVSYLRKHPGVAYVDDVLVATRIGSSEQLTASSRAIPEVELPEWELVLRKHRPEFRVERWLKILRVSAQYPSLHWHELRDLPLSADTAALAALGGMAGRRRLALLRRWGRPTRRTQS